MTRLNPANAWQPMETAPLDGAIVEGINRSMEMPVDMRFGVYRLVIGDIVSEDRIDWHEPYSRPAPTICPEFWRPKTTDDKLSLFRFKPLVEWPPLPEPDQLDPMRDCVCGRSPSGLCPPACKP